MFAGCGKNKCLSAHLSCLSLPQFSMTGSILSGSRSTLCSVSHTGQKKKFRSLIDRTPSAGSDAELNLPSGLLNSGTCTHTPCLLYLRRLSLLFFSNFLSFSSQKESSLFLLYDQRDNDPERKHSHIFHTFTHTSELVSRRPAGILI